MVYPCTEILSDLILLVERVRRSVEYCSATGGDHLALYLRKEFDLILVILQSVIIPERGVTRQVTCETFVMKCINLNVNLL